MGKNIKENEFSITCQVILPVSEVEKIDKERNGMPRSYYLRDIIMKRGKKWKVRFGNVKHIVLQKYIM